MTCTFGEGVQTDLTANGPKTERSNDVPMLILFREINPKEQTARMVGNAIPEGVQVKFINGANAMTFIEITESGNVNTTSVFPNDDGKTARAVHSRHFASYGIDPFPSQRFGTCRKDS